jgi:hypothetical protein
MGDGKFMGENFELWKQDLQMRLLKHVTRERALRSRGVTHALESHGELEAFALGAASVFTKIIGRAITADDLEFILPLYDYVGSGFLVLEGLNDFDLVDVAHLPGDEIAYPLTGCVTLGENFRRNHNHSICCPGCDDCPNFVRKISTLA